jgi:hypothetical protein
MYVNYKSGGIDRYEVEHLVKLVNNLDLISQYPNISYIQVDGEELRYIRSMGYHNTGKTVQIYVGDEMRSILANW